MPAGNDQLGSLEWQPLPGAAGASIFPLIRKIDTVSSNSYLIQTPDAIILIDPGGLTAQAEQLMQVVTECRAAKERPFFILLTHAHIDHFIAIQNTPALAVAGAAVLMVQEEGARSLEQGDAAMTQAAMFDMSIAPIKAGFRLITADRRENAGVPVDLCFTNGSLVTVTAFSAGAASWNLNVETIVFGPGSPPIEVFHTPGHSRDSICIRMGELLFIGDLLFAANPGIAGLVGWSQEDLIRSLDGIAALLEKKEISLLCPGHGRLIPVADAQKMLPLVKRDAAALRDIAEFNPDRAAEIAAYAEDIMEQVNQLFTVMAGRLYYISYVLDELEESGTAAELGTLIRGDDIDGLLDAFRAFSEEHHTKKGVSVHLALKAGQVIGKLQRTFKTDDLSHIIDPGIVRRTERLLADYITIFRGFTPPREVTVVDLSSLIEALVEGLTIPPLSSDALFSSADDEKAFARILLSSIGTRPLLEDVDVVIDNFPDPLFVTIDSENFTDLLTYILEDLVGKGSPAIRITVCSSGGCATVGISGTIPSSSPGCGSQKTDRFLSGLCERAGASLSVSQRNDGISYTIQANRVV
ncbi:MAG TPA: MBL fold metallo-hydrolase [Methanoregula sp.]|nr:MBL fold metallo-hydrolase [Methanoregula sp.]